jgi:hypothetical protein
MYIYIYIYIHIRMIHTYIHTYICIYIYTYIHTYICVCVCVYRGLLISERNYNLVNNLQEGLSPEEAVSAIYFLYWQKNKNIDAAL